MIIDEIPEKSLDSFYLNNPFYLKENKERPDDKSVESMIDFIIELLNFPNYPKLYSNFLYNIYFLNHLSRILWKKLSPSYRSKLIQKTIIPDIRSLEPAVSLETVRILGREGLYPNIEIPYGNSKYTIHHGFPLLITEDSSILNMHSDVNFMNLEELKFGTAVLFSVEHPMVYFHFENNYMIEMDKRAFENVNKAVLNDLFFELLLIKARNDDKPNFLSGNRLDFKPYEFVAAKVDIEQFCRVIDSISSNNELLLRTLFLFIKSKMLFANIAFGEDAIANVLFTIEGSLLLIQQKVDPKSNKINIKQLTSIFIDKFKNGEDLFNVIQEGYDKRIRIVHALPKEGASWDPYLSHDDFYKYYDIAKMLIYYILTDEVIDLE